MEMSMAKICTASPKCTVHVEGMLKPKAQAAHARQFSPPSPRPRPPYQPPGLALLCLVEVPARSPIPPQQALRHSAHSLHPVLHRLNPLHFQLRVEVLILLWRKMSRLPLARLPS